MCKILPRIKILADTEGITIGALERSIGASKGVLSRAISNGTDIQSKWLQALVDKYPQYSAQWLLSGEGEMLLKDDELPRTPISEENIDIETLPRIPFDAAAGSLSLISQCVSVNEGERYPVINRFPHYDFTIMVKGDSMEPEFHSGDELACRFIDKPSFIQWGRPHVLDTRQGVVLKRIYNQSDSILCKSINKDYGDFEIPKEEILRIALVVGSIRLY
ncbi:MAG: helix-turn-helix transcriptional regulator [Bacteroidales bacterium]|nr:helix-turn-helix transcriptional regulator [Bacteroidales bacterium]